MIEEKQAPVDNLKQSFQKIIHNKKAGGILLAISVVIAIAIANSPWAHDFHAFFDQELGFRFDGETYLELSIHHWINDGLMAIFFFVVGLELKREILSGELSNPKKAILPITAALGGVIIPAIIYIILNPSGETQNGWGIPMATDIAFALGILYLLGDKVPSSLKVFLTALAIVDDLCAILVIAFFYTSDISFISLSIGFGFLGIMIIGNRLGIRNVLFYALLGIAGVWTAFLLSGVHATIAAVLVAFTIPSDTEIKESLYISRLKEYLNKFKATEAKDNIPTVTEDQLLIIDQVKEDTDKMTPPSQKLEHTMDSFVTFFVIPIFALANAGVALDTSLDELFSTNVALAVFLGLMIGKVVGIVGSSLLLIKFNIAKLPEGMNIKNLFGLGLLASIGFTMSLFITALAFTNDELITQAKIGIFTASIIGGVLGYIVLNKQLKE